MNVKPLRFYVTIVGVSVILWVVLYMISDIPLYPSVSLLLFLFAYFLFIKRTGNAVAFRELALLVTILQLLLASLLAFYIHEPNFFYMPEGDPQDYFVYAIPGVIAFGLGLFVFKNKLNFRGLKEFFYIHQHTFRIGKQLIIIGYVAVPLQLLMPGSIAYFFNIISSFTYIGGLMILFSNLNRGKKILWISIAYFVVVKDALGAGIFFMTIVWFAFLFMYMLVYNHWKFTLRLSLFSIGLVTVLILDSAKNDYREIVWLENNQLSLTERVFLISGLLAENANVGDFFSEKNVSGRITRANQGALVTWVMNHVPQEVPHANGQTIIRALEGAIFPRFIRPNKIEAGGKENFETYTGRILRGTSMNISLLGEGWANFGYFGGILFMFGVGFFYSLAYRWFSNFILKYPLYFFFIPLVFLYTIKAEDDLVTPLNHLVKTVFVLIPFHYFYFKKVNQKFLSSANKSKAHTPATF
jgi:hypothetical protein